MALKDLLKGRVMKVRDGKKVELSILEVKGNNNGTYAARETVKIVAIKPYLYAKRAELSMKGILEKMLLDKDVSCLVHRRDPDGIIQGDLFLL